MDFVGAFLQSNFATVTITVTTVIGIVFYFRQIGLRRTITFGLIGAFLLSVLFGILYAATPSCKSPLASSSAPCIYPTLAQEIFLILSLTFIMLAGLCIGWSIGYGFVLIFQKVRENVQ